jgi:cytosine/adenosine deaminase-related metal-dependent hydrolase
MMSQPITLANAVVVQHDRIERRDLTFANGIIVDAVASARRVDARDCFVYPGLINAHDHLQLNAIPSLAHDATFADSYEWIDAFEPYLQAAPVAAAVAVPHEIRYWQGAYKNLLSGVTSVAHHDPLHDVVAMPNFPIDVVRDFGWSHSLGLGASRADVPRRYGPAVTESFRDTASTNPWVIHLAEGTSDRARRELAELDAMGCLAEHTVLVHGVALGQCDLQRVIEVGASVVWCPASNLGMFGETLDPRQLFDAGRITLGTDSRLTGSRDLLDELRVAASCSDLEPRELLRLVTADASGVMRRAERGVLAAGARADCLILTDKGDPYETLLSAARGDVRAVVRSGELCVGDEQCARWFSTDESDAVPVIVDGTRKFMMRRMIHPAAAALEPGLEVS